MWKGLASGAAACAGLLVVGAGTGARPASAAPKPAEVTVLSWNLYLGADLVPVIAALSTAPEQAPVVVKQVLDDVRTTNFPARAKKLAELIAAADPDVVALQECVLWRTQRVSDVVAGNLVPNATDTLYDFKATLLKELKKRHRRYKAIATTVGSDVEAPVLNDDLASVGDARLTDRDVILVKHGVKVRATQTANFQASMVLPVLAGVSVKRTYTVIDARVRKRDVRIVATHLESDSEPVRAAQAQELVDGPLDTDLPVILLGDFNSDAEQTTKEATYTTIVGAGFADVWPALHPGDPGLTWGQQPLLDNATSTATQRIDILFTKGSMTAKSMDLLGEVPEDRTGGLWPSDHAGFAATVELQ